MSQPGPPFRSAFEAQVADPVGDLRGLRDAFRAQVSAEDLPDDRLDDLLFVAALLARAAFCSPEVTTALYDDLAAAWLDGEPFQLSHRDLSAETRAALATPAAWPPGLLEALWALLDEGVDAETITPRIAALGATYPPAFRRRLADVMQEFPGVPEFLAMYEMPRTQIEVVAACDEGSLGRVFHDLIVDNGYDLEVLDPDSIADYEPALDRVNRRILQTHEIWHLIAGYSTSPMHEVAISGFQLAQFGHPYSRDFLAAAFLFAFFQAPALAPVFLQVTFEGWRHGRSTRPLLTVDWHERWSDRIEDLRREFAVLPFASRVPDLPMDVAVAS